MRITEMKLTPIAVPDPPLRNSWGIHEPVFMRVIIQLKTDNGLEGLGEAPGGGATVASLEATRGHVIGMDPWQLEPLRVTLRNARLYSALEEACLDLIGKATGRPVSDLLGGAVRDTVPFSAYLFYKWAGHPGRPDDDWGEALTPDQLVVQAKRMVTAYGFDATKLKGGVLPPGDEIEAMRALRDAFPEHKLRIDPNGGWTVDTSVRVAHELADVLEYLEDPTPGIDGMAAVARETDLPLATNMCVIAFEHLAPAVRANAVGVVLSDHHLWGGLLRSRLLAGICDTFGMGLSMHSNSHLGISLAAMTHLAAATPNLTYACDTHYPWKTEDLIKPGVLTFVDGSVRVPSGPGLGVELDLDELGRLHEQYLSSGIRKRDDTTYMRTVQPDFTPNTARW
jgi:glucarate dehydratase